MTAQVDEIFTSRGHRSLISENETTKQASQTPNSSEVASTKLLIQNLRLEIKELQKSHEDSTKKLNNTVIFLPIKPTPVSGIVPNAKKYVFFPIEAGKIPKMTDIFPFRLLFILIFCKPSLSLSFLVNF